jgi:hypothetical protein
MASVTAVMVAVGFVLLDAAALTAATRHNMFKQYFKQNEYHGRQEETAIVVGFVLNFG